MTGGGAVVGGTDQAVAVSAPAVLWRGAVFGAAVVGGAFWGLVAALTIGAAGDAARHAAQDGPRLGLAALVTAGCVVVGALVVAAVRRRTGPGPRAVRSGAVAVILGPLSGWLVVGSLAVQAAVQR